jgi:hypothetical protein
MKNVLLSALIAICVPVPKPKELIIAVGGTIVPRDPQLRPIAGIVRDGSKIQISGRAVLAPVT